MLRALETEQPASAIPQKDERQPDPAVPVAEDTPKTVLQKLGYVLLGIALLLAAFVVLKNLPRPLPKTPSADAAVPTTATPPPRRIDGRLSRDALGCASKVSAADLSSMQIARDTQSIMLLLLSGACEIVPAGTRLDLDEDSIFSVSKYRVFGAARSLYVVDPSFE